MAKAPSNDILSLIQADHHKLEQLFEQVATAQGKELYDCFFQLYTELNLHARGEEIVFYPAMCEYKETEKYIEAAEAEHEDAETLLEQLKNLEPDSTDFQQTLEDLKAAVWHHVEEEESEIFDVVRQCMDEQQLIKLGQEFQTVKSRYQEAVEAAIAQ
jgi:hemerythrin superfamily protein